MDYKDLVYLTAIEKYHTMTKASQMLHVSQPTLSKCLKNIEEDIGLKLFKQVGHTMIPTYEGNIFLEQAHKMLILKQETDQKMTDLLTKKISKLVIGFPTMRCSYVLPSVLPDFSKEYPNVEFKIIEGNSEYLDNLLLKGEIDVAFYTVEENIQKEIIQYETIKNEKLLLCTPSGHPIKEYAKENPDGLATINIHSLVDEKLLLPAQGTRTRTVIDDILKKNNITFEQTFECSNLQAIMGLVKNNFGISFLFEPHIDSKSRDFDCYLIENINITARFVAAYRKDTYLSAYAREFINKVKEL